MLDKQYSYTGCQPEKGYVGYVNISEKEEGICFTVRSQGLHPNLASYIISKDEAVLLLQTALSGINSAD